MEQINVKRYKLLNNILVY